MFVMTHKNFEVPEIDDFFAIEVGAAIRDSNYGYIKDDSFDNISEKNNSFCELTGLYWIWKNVNCEYIGLCHYRRYFSKFLLESNPCNYYSMDHLVNLLKRYDIILPKCFCWRRHTVETAYYQCGCGKKKDLGIIREIIEERYPKYANVFDSVMKQKRASYCNMFVCSKDKLDEYCEWLFDILFEAEKRIDISNYSKEEARVFGYMSEILLNVWVKEKHYRVKYVPVVTNAPLSFYFRILSKLEKFPVLGIIASITLCKDIR